MQGFFTVIAPAIWILAKQDVLHGASGYFKVQVPPFVIPVLKKHKNRNPHCEQLIATTSIGAAILFSSHPYIGTH